MAFNSGPDNGKKKTEDSNNKTNINTCTNSSNYEKKTATRISAKININSNRQTRLDKNIIVDYMIELFPLV